MTRLNHLQPYQLNAMRNAMNADGCPELVRFCWKDVPEPTSAEMIRMASACEAYQTPGYGTTHEAKLLRLMAMGAQWTTIDVDFPGHPDVLVVLQ